MKIEKLTQEQWSKLPEFVDRWVGYASEPINYPRLEKSVTEIYALMGKKKPQILIARNPYEAVVTAVALPVVCKSGKSVKEALRSTLYSPLDSTLYSTLNSTLDSTLYSTLENIKDEQINKFYSNAYDASSMTQYWGFWAGYYEYAKFIGVKFDEQKFETMINFVREVNHCLAFESIFIVSQKPKKIHWKELPHEENKPVNRILHRDGGISIEYDGDFKIYHLNNVAVPEYLATTKDGELSLDFFLKEKNADVKAEFIKKYGIDRMHSHGEAIDSWKKHDNEWWTLSEYELIDMSKVLSDAGYSTKYAPYLWMKNQTTGTYHMEGVSPDCKTLQEAMAFRIGETETYKIGGIK